MLLTITDIPVLAVRSCAASTIGLLSNSAVTGAAALSDTAGKHTEAAGAMLTSPHTHQGQTAEPQVTY